MPKHIGHKPNREGEDEEERERGRGRGRDERSASVFSRVRVLFAVDRALAVDALSPGVRERFLQLLHMGGDLVELLRLPGKLCFDGRQPVIDQGAVAVAAARNLGRLEALPIIQVEDFERGCLAQMLVGVQGRQQLKDLGGKTEGRRLGLSGGDGGGGPAGAASLAGATRMQKWPLAGLPAIVALNPPAGWGH